MFSRGKLGQRYKNLINERMHKPLVRPVLSLAITAADLSA